MAGRVAPRFAIAIYRLSTENVKRAALTQSSGIMTPRSFVFSVWVANNKEAAKTVSALEAIASNNFAVAKEGGKVITSVSMGGKSYSFALPPDQTAGTVAELAFYAWKQIKDLSAADLELWLTRKTNKTTIAAFNYPLT
jgi:hypothetical protein